MYNLIFSLKRTIFSYAELNRLDVKMFTDEDNYIKFYMTFQYLLVTIDIKQIDL
jgi:hypothetical protein